MRTLEAVQQIRSRITYGLRNASEEERLMRKLAISIVAGMLVANDPENNYDGSKQDEWGPDCAFPDLAIQEATTIVDHVFFF